MAGINKVILVGNLGADPEVRSLENGVKVARINVATTEVYRDKNGERRELTEWHSVTLWRGLADVAERYLQKGKQVYIEGKLKTRKWTDNEGRERYTTEVIGDVMQMLGRVGDGEKGSHTRSSGGEYQSSSTNDNAPKDSKPELESQSSTDNKEDHDLPF